MSRDQESEQEMVSLMAAIILGGALANPNNDATREPTSKIAQRGIVLAREIRRQVQGEKA